MRVGEHLRLYKEWLKFHVNKKPPDAGVKQIIVAASQRSGSSMVCEDLTNTGVLGKPEEWFLSWNIEVSKDWKAEFERVHANGDTPNGVFGAKIMANQIHQIDKCLATFTKTDLTGPYPSFRQTFDNATWLWVRRHDVISQAISHYIAQKRGIYHTVSNTNGYMPGSAVVASTFNKDEADIPYEFQPIISEWSKLERENLVWKTFFSESGIKPLTIWYEDSQQENAAVTLWRHMGIDCAPIAAPRNLKKLPQTQNAKLRHLFVTDLLERA